MAKNTGNMQGTGLEDQMRISGLEIRVYEQCSSVLQRNFQQELFATKIKKRHINVFISQSTSTFQHSLALIQTIMEASSKIKFNNQTLNPYFSLNT